MKFSAGSAKYLYPLFLWAFNIIILYNGGTAWADKDNNILFKEAEQLFQAGEFHAALEKYKELISIDPSSIKGYRGVTQCYNSLGDPQAALKYMESLFLEHPEKGEVSCGLGYSLYCLGRYDDALAHFKKAIELNGDIAEAWNNCGVIYHFINKDYRKARYYYEKAIEISERSGDDSVFEIARENMTNLPEPAELKPITEKMTLEDFINRFIACADNNNHKEIQELILGQKENGRKAMEWLIGKATRSHIEGRLQDEKTLILLAEILQDEYSISFKSPELNEMLSKYKNLSGSEKKKIVEGEGLLEDGLIKEQDGKYPEAGIKYQEALKCFAGINDKAGQGLAMLYLADVQRKLKNYSLAYDMYNKCLSFFIETGEMERRANALSSLGETCFMMGRHSEAIDYMNKSLEIYSVLQNQEAIIKVQRNLELIKTNGLSYPVE
jgi:tetratricopeptide (TPR) repeat protein